MIHTAKYHLDKLDHWASEDIERAITDAQIEAIKESADLCDETEDNRFEHKHYILKLLDQIK